MQTITALVSGLIVGHTIGSICTRREDIKKICKYLGNDIEVYQILDLYKPKKIKDKLHKHNLDKLNIYK